MAACGILIFRGTRSHPSVAMRSLSHVWMYRRLFVILLTPLLLLPLPLLVRTKEAECAYVLFIVGIFWLSEALPLAVTAFLPALMFPLFGIMKSKEVASAYFKDFHLLLTGVICLATSIEKWNLHKRIALKMVMLVGVNPAWLMLGFMVSTGFLSMWLSNTSTAAMVMPIVEAVAQQIMNAEAEVDAIQMSDGILNEGLELDENIKECEANGLKEKAIHVTGYINGHATCSIDLEKTKDSLSITSEHTKNPVNAPERTYRSRKDHMMCKAMCLCIAYSSTIGGLTTITGTSTNLIFAEQFNMRYPNCTSINFGSWFGLSFPITVILMVLSWAWIQWLFLGFNFTEMFKCGKERTAREKASAQVIEEEYKKLGLLSYEEIMTLILFVIMALLWFTRDPGFFPGWASLFPKYFGYANDSTAALLLGLLFFIIPAKKMPVSSSGESNSFDYMPLITWKEFQKCMPWEIAILVGGGFALAQGCEDSNLSAWIGSKLTPLGSLPVWLIILISSLIVTSVTEVASNPATITIFLPILAPLAEAIHVNPLYILIPTTLCTSFAFLLPVANPPNAIVFAYGHLQVMDMVKAGLGINLIGVAVVMLGITTWAVPMFDLLTYPSWAPNSLATNTTGL
ncbi:solute carrier family 13 member 1 [Rhinatrema bivittatum]|uniref:solute carrier family 13 member 1 n=1 Tax=Rhinatrema bivittatum TaxID=194408 RepID=UPI0011286682|nr:solute carrier family 13 member 1 [Rhinatrema bivittatum]XP_029472096.1 solute carrier family 13 member 1 [Rhinatrema bivittatum]